MKSDEFEGARNSFSVLPACFSSPERVAEMRKGKLSSYLDGN